MKKSEVLITAIIILVASHLATGAIFIFTDTKGDDSSSKKDKSSNASSSIVDSSKGDSSKEETTTTKKTEKETTKQTETTTETTTTKSTTASTTKTTAVSTKESSRQTTTTTKAPDTKAQTESTTKQTKPKPTPAQLQNAVMPSVNSAISLARSKSWDIRYQGVSSSTANKYSYTVRFYLDISKVTGKSVTLTVTWTASVGSDNSIVTSVNPSNYLSELTRHPF